MEQRPSDTSPLLAELNDLRRRISDMEMVEAERNRVWETVQEREEQYRAAVENVADAIVINVGTTRVFVNNAFLTLHGLDDMSQASGLSLDHFIITGGSAHRAGADIGPGTRRACAGRVRIPHPADYRGSPHR